MSNHITVVIKYEDDEDQPSFHANMRVLGGTIEGVMFSDALAQLEHTEQTIETLRERLGE